MNHATRQRERQARPVPKPKNRAHAQPEEDSLALWVRHLGKSLVITLIAGTALLLIGSLIAYFTPDSNTLIRPIGMVAAALTALIGGFAALRIHRHAALMCGLLNGSLTTALMILVSLFFKDYSSGYSTGISCLLHTAFLLLSVAGAYLGLKRKPKRK